MIYVSLFDLKISLDYLGMDSRAISKLVKIDRNRKFQKCSRTHIWPSVTSRDLLTNSFQHFKKNEPDIAYGCIKKLTITIVTENVIIT